MKEKARMIAKQQQQIIEREESQRLEGKVSMRNKVQYTGSERPLENLRPLPFTVSLPLEYLTAVLPLYRYTAVM